MGWDGIVGYLTSHEAYCLFECFSKLCLSLTARKKITFCLLLESRVNLVLKIFANFVVDAGDETSKEHKTDLYRGIYTTYMHFLFVLILKILFYDLQKSWSVESKNRMLDLMMNKQVIGIIPVEPQVSYFTQTYQFYYFTKSPCSTGDSRELRRSGLL